MGNKKNSTPEGPDNTPLTSEEALAYYKMNPPKSLTGMVKRWGRVSDFTDSSETAREPDSASERDPLAPYGWTPGTSRGLNSSAIAHIRRTSKRRGLGDYRVVHTTPVMSNKGGLGEPNTLKSELIHGYSGESVGFVSWMPNGGVGGLYIHPDHTFALSHLIATSWDYAESMGVKGPQGGHLVDNETQKKIAEQNRRSGVRRDGFYW